MSKKHKFLWYAPRALAILFILFISIFALDVFDAGYSGFELFIALFMHLIPSFIFASVTFVAWKKPRVGGWFYVLLSVISVFFFKTYGDFISLVSISVIPFLIGFLFFISSRVKKY